MNSEQREKDFKKAAEEYDDSPDAVQRIIARTGFEFGAEHGYQYAVDMIAKHLLCIELSNFFPTLDEDEEIAKGRKKLIEFIRKAMEDYHQFVINNLETTTIKVYWPRLKDTKDGGLVSSNGRIKF